MTKKTVRIETEDILQRVEEIETHWEEDYCDFQEEAVRIAILELALEKLGYNIGHLLGDKLITLPVYTD